MKSMVRCAVLFLVLAVAVTAVALVNPHDKANADRCFSCHTDEVMGQQCGADVDFCLLTDSIDGVCLICHRTADCCEVGQDHGGMQLGHSHPSDLDEAKVKRKHRPKTLPVQNGLITCNTCHLHEKAEGGDHMLVRIVRITDKGIDWTGLCADCHDEYL